MTDFLNFLVSQWMTVLAIGVVVYLLLQDEQEQDAPDHELTPQELTFKINNSKKASKKIIFLICLLAFFIASQGMSILYLFLIADLLCCAAVLTVFYGYYNKNFKEKNAYISIIFGLIVGLLLFPNQDFSKSILVGFIIPIEYFSDFIVESLLFLSFILATFTPILTWKIR